MKRWVVLVPALLAVLSAEAEAQEPGRMLLEGGVVGGNSISCPGHYVGVEGHLRYGVSAYGMVENYQCAEIPETSSRVGLALQLGPDRWWARPALRSGLNYAYDGDVTGTYGASLTFGRRYGARVIVDRWTVPNGNALVLTQIGGFIRF